MSQTVNTNNQVCRLINAIDFQARGQAGRLEIMELLTNVNGVNRGPVGETSHVEEWFAVTTFAGSRRGQSFKSLAAAKEFFAKAQASIGASK